MKFVQIMEQTGDVEEARAEIEGYFSSADTETKVKKLMLCTDRDVPGKMVTIVEFESWDTATDNNELDATQEGAAEATGGAYSQEQYARREPTPRCCSTPHHLLF